MSRAQRYDRAVGFFSSTIYVLAWRALKAFVSNGGHMRIVCSPVLGADDASALYEGYTQRAEEEYGNRLAEAIQQMLADDVLQEPTRVLAALVAGGVADVRIAFVTASQDPVHERLFHDKLGIFSDASGATVAFKGSMNETKWCFA